jgi:hypothetical protein
VWVVLAKPVPGASIASEFWQSGYFEWIGHAWLGRAATATTEQVVEILWPALFALAAALIYGLRKAVSEKQARQIRLALRG